MRFYRSNISKKIILSTIIVGLISNNYMPIQAMPSYSLNDINGHWAEGSIIEFLNKGYITGYEDNTFKPDKYVTRAEFVKIVNKVFDFTELAEEDFTDVNPSDWFYNDIKIAVNQGYIQGNGDGTFKPNNLISREEASIIITNIMENKDVDLDKLKTYKDADKVSSWATSSVEGMLEDGYLLGYSDNTIGPQNQVSRAQAVVMLDRTDGNEATIEKVTKMYVTNTSTLNVRTGPGTSYDIVGVLSRGTEVEVVSNENGWAKVKYNGDYAYVSMSYLTTTIPGQTPLPIPTMTPTYVDSPENSQVISSNQDIYQSKITVSKSGNGDLTSLAISTDGEFGVTYQVYANGSWNSASNGDQASNANKSIEGVRISLQNAPEDYHIFYRTKIKNQGWQAWVKDNKISGEIGNEMIIEDIQIRIVVSNDTNSMVKPTIAVDIGHNVPRPTLYGAINGIYDEDYLTKIIGEKIIYKLRSMGYNVVNTLPKGSHTQSNELTKRAQIANLNEVDKFVSLHFNSATPTANGTEVYYSTSRSESSSMAKYVVDNLANTYNFTNRGAKNGDHLAVIRNTTMPAILVEGCFISNQSDMDKFISKGSSTYDIMAQNIIDGIIN